MKSAWLIAAVFASVVAGAGGGFVASHYLAPEQSAPTQVEVANLDPGEMDHSADLQKQSDEIARLRTELQALQVRVDKAEQPQDLDAETKKQIADLQAKVANLKATGGTVVAGDGSGEAGAAPDPNTTEFEAAVNAAIEKREAAQRAERDEQRRQQMEQWAAQRNKSIVDKLSTELSLTEVQKANIETILNDMNTKRGEVMQRGREAREKGEEFDWGAEMTAANSAAVEAVRAELSSAQLTTFNELLGESNSLDSLAPGGGGFGMGGRRPQRGN